MPIAHVISSSNDTLIIQHDRYVTVEICNFFQSDFIEKDLQLYHEDSDTPARARTSNMNADLGNISSLL
jgi:hypothetical protein